MVTTRKKTGTKKTGASKPLVSIVMPVFNAAKIIDDTIHSVLGQSVQDFELIIVDDCSTDNTLEVVGQFKSDKIRTIAGKKNVGAVNATNRGIRAAKGKYLAFIDAGDVWQPNKLSKQLDFMSENDAGFVFSSYVFADKKGRPKGKIVRMPATIDVSRSGLIMTSTVMLDMKKLTKNDAKMESGDKKWWGAFGKVKCGYGMYGVMMIKGYDAKLSFFEKMRRGVR